VVVDKKQKLLYISTIVLTGFTLSVFYHYAMGVYFNHEYPYNTFLCVPQDRWTDFIWPYKISADPYHAARADFQNFPFLYKIAALFSFFKPETARNIYLLVYVLAFFHMTFTQFKLEDKVLSLKNAFILSFLTYPFLFAFDRANFEIVVFFCLYLYIFLYRKYPWISALFLGFSIALKGFPVILAVLLLADRRYKEIAIAAIISLSTTLLSYATLPGGVSENVTLQLRNLQLYAQAYAIGNAGLAFGNSLWGAIKFMSIHTSSQMISTVTYTILVVIGLMGIVIYVVFIEKKFWKRTALLICALNLFPQVSADYKLLHIFIPLFLFISETEFERIDWLYLVVFGLLLIPKDYYHLPTLPEASMSILLNPLLMLVLTILIMATGLVRCFRLYNVHET